jgi:hypothetical protein
MQPKGEPQSLENKSEVFWKQIGQIRSGLGLELVPDDEF